MKKLKISQSLIKDVANYEKKELCGKVITHKFIEGKFMPTTDVMNQGQFFEFLATGSLPKNNKEPKPEKLKDGKTLNLPYRRAESQANNFKRLCEKMGIKILQVQQTKEHKGLIASRDLQVEWEGNKYTVDLKYSGLLHDEWAPMGWGGLINFDSEHRGHLRQMTYHKIQAIQYQHVFGDPFIYWVFSSSTGAEESGENMMFKLNTSEFETDQHLILAQATADKFNFLNNLGWANYPEYNRCQGCLLKDTCEDFLDVPKPIELEII